MKLFPALVLCYSTIAFADTPKAIVIGASSGMGREVARLLSADGYHVGLAARRVPVLEALQHQLPHTSYVQMIDAAKPKEAVHHLHELIAQLGGLDLLVISITGFYEDTYPQSIFDVDLLGFYALAHAGFTFFEKQGHGHLVGFSSMDGLRGIARCPEYSAAKSFCSRYMEAKRNYYLQKHIPITVTDIIPGWVNQNEDPDYAQKYPEAYWIDSLADASREIFEAIKKKVSRAYITKRWEQVAAMIQVMPDELYNAFGGL